MTSAFIAHRVRFTPDLGAEFHVCLVGTIPRSFVPHVIHYDDAAVLKCVVDLGKGALGWQVKIYVQKYELRREGMVVDLRAVRSDRVQERKLGKVSLPPLVVVNSKFTLHVIAPLTPLLDFKANICIHERIEGVNGVNGRVDILWSTKCSQRNRVVMPRNTPISIKLPRAGRKRSSSQMSKAN